MPGRNPLRQVVGRIRGQWEPVEELFDRRRDSEEGWGIPFRLRALSGLWRHCEALIVDRSNKEAPRRMSNLSADAKIRELIGTLQVFARDTTIM
jgi:hypothetical protein